MYDAHHRRLARLYILVIIFLISAISLLAYLLPAQTAEQLEAQLLGVAYAPFSYSSNHIAAIARPSIVRLYSRMNGTVSFPSVLAKVVDGKFVLNIGSDSNENQIDIENYVKEGTGVFVGQHHIATTAHTVSPEWVYADMFVELVDRVVSDTYWQVYFDESIGQEERDSITALYESFDAKDYFAQFYETFRQRMIINVEHTIFVKGSDNDNKNYTSGDVASIVAEFQRSFEPSDGRDVAVLSVNLSGASTLMLNGGGSLPRLGSKIYSIGYPTTADTLSAPATETTFTGGSLVSLTQFEKGSDRYEIDAKIIFRSSGSPLIDEHARIIGFITDESTTRDATNDNSNVHAIPVTYLLELLDASDISLEPSEAEELLYEAFGELSAGECLKAKEMFTQIDTAHLRNTQTNYVEEYAESCEGSDSSIGAIERMVDWIRNTDSVVLILIGTLSTLVLVLFLILLYLRSRLLAEETVIGSLKRFVSRAHSIK